MLSLRVNIILFEKTLAKGHTVFKNYFILLFKGHDLHNKATKAKLLFMSLNKIW